MKALHIFCFLILLFVSCLIQAQGVLEVATKTVEKQLPYNSKGTIVLNGENATIKIDSWDKQEIKIKLKLIAKHRIKTVAVNELNNIKYLMEKEVDDVFLRNYFLSNNESSTGCVLKVEYELTVPAKSNINIKNNLGNIELKNTEGKIEVNSKFGNLNLFNVKGSVKVNVSLGDIQAVQISGAVTVKANNSEISMENLLGKYYFTLVSSDLSFKPSNDIERLNVETKNGDVNIFFDKNDIYYYKFNTLYGEIKVPEALKAKVVNEKNKSSLNYSMNTTNQPIFINSNFGNITLINNLIIK